MRTISEAAEAEPDEMEHGSLCLTTQKSLVAWRRIISVAWIRPEA